MKVNNIEKRFNEVSKNDTIRCTQEEFNNFENYGYLIPSGKSYVTRNGKKINIDIIKQKKYLMNIDLSNIISKVLNTDNNRYKRVYCMSNATFNKYIEEGYIIEKDGNSYYRLFEGEMWLIMII